MPQVAVTAVTGICGEWKINSMCLAVFNFGFTGIHCPFITSPSCNNFQIRGKCFDTEFETNLVISFSGSTMADSSSAFFSCNFNKTFCNNRTSHRSTKKVFVLIYGMSLYTRNYIFITELIDNILNVKFGCTTELSSFFQTVQFFTLSTINADTDNFIIKILFKPWNNCCCIQAAGIS